MCVVLGGAAAATPGSDRNSILVQIDSTRMTVVVIESSNLGDKPPARKNFI